MLYLGSVVSSPARVQFVDTEDVTARQDTGNLAIEFDEQLPQANGGRQDIFIEDVSAIQTLSNFWYNFFDGGL